MQIGGRGRIRTYGWVAPSPDFESGALNHSATLPSLAARRWSVPKRIPAASPFVSGRSKGTGEERNKLPRAEACQITAYSDAVGHLFQSMSESVPTLSDSNRSEATLCASHKVVSGRRQGIAMGLELLRSPSEGRRFGPPTQGVVAPSLRAGGERRERTPELQFAFPPVATRHGLTRPPAEARL